MTEPAAPPHPPIVAVKPDRQKPRPHRDLSGRNYERAPTAQHTLKPRTTESIDE